MIDEEKAALYLCATESSELHAKRIDSAEEWAHKASASELILAITGADGKARGQMAPYMHTAACRELDLRIPRRPR